MNAARMRWRSAAASGRVFGTAERLLALVVTGDVGRRAVDDLEGGLITGLVVVAPRAHAVMAQQHALGPGMLFDQRLDHQTDVEPRALPWDVDHVVAVNLPAETLLVDRSRDGNHGVRMQVIDVAIRYERVKRRVDRAGARIEVIDAVAVHRVHRVFDGRLRAALGGVFVQRPHRPHLVEIERSKPVAIRRPQIAARPLDPEHLHLRSAQRVFFHQLRRSVPTAGIGQGQIFPKPVRTVDQAIDASQAFGFFVLPEVLHVLEGFCLLIHCSPSHR